MKKTPFLSVIMPVYNAEGYLKEAVGSILNQTFKDLEVICVNDCSPDDSLAVLRKLAETDSRVKVIDSPVNVGAGAARNLGIEVAEGEYITFVDSDDVIESNLYERAISMCDAGKIDEVVWGVLEKHYNAKNELIKTIKIVPQNADCVSEDGLLDAILDLEEKTLFGYQWNSIYKSSIIKEHNIRFEKAILYEDFFFNLEFAKHMSSMATLDYAGYLYFKRVNSSITHRFTKDYYELSYRRVHEMYDFCQLYGKLNGDVYRILGNKLLRYTLSALCRNYNVQSGMDAKQRKKWFLDICEKSLYKKILPQCVPSNVVFSFLKSAIMQKKAFSALALSKIVSILR